MNGGDMNGGDMNGGDMNGGDMNGGDMNGTALHALTLDGTLFTALTADGTQLRGLDFVGVTFRGLVAPLRIDGIQQGTGANDDVYFYSVSYQSEKGWRPLCGTDPTTGAPRLAIPLAGYWDKSGAKVADPSRLTFACRRYALAKCVELGYKPWKTVNGQSLEAHHQACTRLMRADYCGDGKSWTVNGRLVNIYDRLGIQRDTEPWNVEAEWTADGASCVRTTRLAFLEDRGLELPACLRERTVPTCAKDTAFRKGTLLVSEFQSQLLARP
jgi:hypothetical protein